MRNRRRHGNVMRTVSLGVLALVFLSQARVLSICGCFSDETAVPVPVQTAAVEDHSCCPGSGASESASSEQTPEETREGKIPCGNPETNGSCSHQECVTLAWDVSEDEPAYLQGAESNITVFATAVHLARESAFAERLKIAPSLSPPTSPRPIYQRIQVYLL